MKKFGTKSMILDGKPLITKDGWFHWSITRTGTKFYLGHEDFEVDIYFDGFIIMNTFLQKRFLERQ